MDDLISRQATIEKLEYGLCGKEWDKELAKAMIESLPSVQPELPKNWWKTDHGYMWLCPHCGLPVHSDYEECLRCGIKRQSAQPEFARDINVPCTETAERTAKPSQNVPNDDLISRKAAIDLLLDKGMITAAIYVERIPSVKQTLCGYNIEHLVAIAMILQKENLPPERIKEILSDVGRIVEITCNEFEESLRNAMEV